MRPNIRFVLYSVVLVLALATLGDLITELVTRGEGSVGIAITMTVLISVCLFIALFNYEPPKTPRQIETAFIKKLRDSWIQSLIDIKRFENIRSVRFNWLARPEALPHLPANPDTDSPKISRIVKAFKKANQSLLIVGRPGAGKTVALLELARGLLDSAEKDPVHRIPVVFNLSSFNGKKLEEWLVQELKTRYDVAEEIGRRWLLQKRLILLLDGLDESNQRDQCAEAINIFAAQPAGPGIAVTTNWETAKLTAIKSAVEIPLDGLDCTKHLAAIIQRLKDAKCLEPAFDAGKVLRWLHWLAARSKERSQSQFTIAQIQPIWLKSEWSKRLYLAASRVTGAFVVMTVGAGLMFLSRGILRSVYAQAEVPGLFDIESHLKWWLLVTVVVGGFTIAFADAVQHGYFSRQQEETKPHFSSRQNIGSLLFYLVMCFIMFLWVARLQIDTLNSVRGATIFAVAYGVVFWFRGRERSLASDTNTADKLVWSRARIPAGVFGGLVGGVLCGVVFAVILKTDAEPWLKIHMLVLLTLLGLMVGVIAGGLRRVSIVENTSPTQGMQMALRSTILIWLSVGAPSILLIWGYVSLVMNKSVAALGGGLFYGMVLGLLCAFAYSGFGIVYRLVFRLIVWTRGHAPLIDWVQFLDYAASLGFLRKVGGGYVFSQTSLRQCFALPNTQAYVTQQLQDKTIWRGSPVCPDIESP